MKPAMNHKGRLIAAIVFFSLTYGGLLALFNMALGPAPQHTPVLWYVWRMLGAVCLSASAADITLFAAWMWTKATGFSADGGVPTRLTTAHRRELAQYGPTLALLMPAHNEASTPEDREALVARIFDILLKTPTWSVFYLLADSSPDQRDNEQSVIRDVKARLHAAGRDDELDRVVLEEYRDKPPLWRHKSGSILRWAERYGARYEFMFLLDADSDFADEDPAKPETCDVAERMLISMIRNPNMAMLQAVMHVGKYETVWGWVQAVNARIGSAFYLKAFAFLFGRETPCYGHNCILRVRDFAQHARNTLFYTSHDHIDASDLAAAGRECVLTDAVVTLEGPEDTLPLWLKRECRWSRGNGQWLVYLLRKRGLPLGPTVFLTLGVLMYTWALLAGIYFVSTIALASTHHQLTSHVHALPARLLIAVVGLTLVVPKLLASPSVREFIGNFIVSMLLSPALMLYQGMAFLLGAFGSGWVPRGSRLRAFNLRQVLRIAGTFLPIALLGVILWFQLDRQAIVGWAGVFMKAMVLFMVASPLTAVLASWPLNRPEPREVSLVPA